MSVLALILRGLVSLFGESKMKSTLQRDIKPLSVPESGVRRRVSVLGSTGSIGRIAVDLLRAYPDRFVTESLISGGKNVALLAEQARCLRAGIAVIADPSAYCELKELLAGSETVAAAGYDAVIEASGNHVDLVIAAIVGFAGLLPTLTALRAGCNIALANKECLVSAGYFFMAEAHRLGVSVIPVDSEHSAIFQALLGANHCLPERLILTSSGGPFRTWPLEKMKNVRPDDALAHPNFVMGRKISIDSATMMNKGLELIEAGHLFDFSLSKIDILVHIEQIVHGFVEFSDGSVLAQLGAPNMTCPVAFALGYPERLRVRSPRLDLMSLKCLHFDLPDEIRFPALRLARQAFSSGNVATCTMNAANEVAVEGFLSGEIGFLDIIETVSETLDHQATGTAKTIEELIDLDQCARDYAQSVMKKHLRP